MCLLLELQPLNTLLSIWPCTQNQSRASQSLLAACEKKYKCCKHTNKAQIPAQTDTVFLFLSFFSPAYIHTHTHNTSSVILYADFNLTLSSTLWVTACRRHGRSSYQGGPSVRSSAEFVWAPSQLWPSSLKANRNSLSTWISVTCRILFSPPKIQAFSVLL